jgi:hypothetical protein
MTTNPFAAGSIGQPPDLGGPDFGLMSLLETDPGGQEAIQSSIRISLNLGGTAPSNLIELIQAGAVGLSFGSPNASVPEPTSLSLFGVGLVFASAALRKRWRQSVTEVLAIRGRPDLRSGAPALRQSFP